METRSLRVLLLGSGGREHALAWKLSQSSSIGEILVAPGNGGTGQMRKVINLDCPKETAPDYFEYLSRRAKDHEVDLVIVGPEAPLVAGIVDDFRHAGLDCFGPSKAAAHLEGSKTYAKDFMARYNIPTARFSNFASYEEAKKHLEEVNYKVVIKATGLAAGKGVIIPSSKAEGLQALKDIMVPKEDGQKAFGSAGDEVVIEEFLDGQELSFLSFVDGYTVKSLLPAQDHKAIFDGDKGPNTGGMGCYAPTPIANRALIEEVHQAILQPTVNGMRKEGAPFKGLLFTGIMVTPNDGPKVLEYNVRFGDPETQTLLPLMEGDLAEILIACINGRLDCVEVRCKGPASSVTVVAASEGYPGSYETGKKIEVSPGIPQGPEDHIFYAGTTIDSIESEGKEVGFKTSGGRVLSTTSVAPTLTEALDRAYKTMGGIRWPGMHVRSDIAHRARKHEVNGITYASAGVSIDNGNTLVERIKGPIKSTARPGALALLGGFGGSFSLRDAGYGGPTLVSGTDGVGTKLKVAKQTGKHDTIGIDLVAMCVNDIAVTGAEVLWFLDTYSCNRLDVDICAQVIEGIVNGCRQANCALIGGETAEMGDTYKPGEYDLVGSSTGAIAEGRMELPNKDSMRDGDVLLGLASSGCHSNGFSLIQKILESKNVDYSIQAPWEDSDLSVGESLLTPTRIYVKSTFAASQRGLIKGMAHITGGGLIENVPRMLPKHLAAEMDATKWETPRVMKWLKKHGPVTDGEFGRVFNTGLGMVVVVAKEDVEGTKHCLEESGEIVWQVGKLTSRSAESAGCSIHNMHAWR